MLRTFLSVSSLSACLLATLGTLASGATIDALSDDFDAGSINAANWNVQAADFEAGSGTYTADVTTNPGQLTLAGVNDISNFWGGITLESVDTFDSSKAGSLTVDRVSLGGAGVARRSSVWMRQTDGTYLHFSQNLGENGWQYNPTSTGGGNNIGALDPLDGDTGSHEMSLAYIPLGGNNARVEMYLDGGIVAAHNFTDWENTTDYNVRLSGMARTAPGDTVSAVFDNFRAASHNGGTPVQNNQQTSTGFTVSSTDILQGLTPTVIGNVNAEEGVTTADTSALTNGNFGNPGVDAGTANEVVAIHNNTTLTYQLGTSPNGWDITGIDVYSGWRDGGRDAQEFSVSYATVDDPDNFIPLDFVNYNPGATSPSDLLTSITEAGGDVLATGVGQLRFAFANTENGYVGYREFDVFGTQTVVPEPASLACWGLLAAGLAAIRYRRRRKN